MGLLFRIALIGLFCLGAYRVSLAQPQTFERPEALAGMAIIAALLLALLLEEIRFRLGQDEQAARRRSDDAERSAPLELGRAHGARPFSRSAPAGVGFLQRCGIALRALVVNVAVWSALVIGFAVAYANRADIKETALVTLSALKPGEPVSLSATETVLTRDGYGHFTTLADVNGRKLRMLIDTGSSDVALPYEDAVRVGLDVSKLQFDRAVMTANGEAKVAPIMLPFVRVGGITLRNVPGSVAEPGKLGSPLLGMSFLSQLREVSIRGDRLWLKI